MVDYLKLIEFQGLKTFVFRILNVAAEEVAEKGSYFVIPNEVRNLSGF